MVARWREKYLPAAAMVVCQSINATAAIFNRAAIVHGMKPLIFVVYRQATATLVISPFAFLHSLQKGKGSGDAEGRTTRRKSVGIKGFMLICACSLFGAVLNPIFYNEGLYYANTSVGTAMFNLVPAITFLMAFIFRLEKVDIRSMNSIAKILGTVVCVIGAVSIVLLKGPILVNNDSLLLFGETGDGENIIDWLKGCMFFLANTSCWSLWLILLVPTSSFFPNDHLSLSAWVCFISTLQAATVALVLEKDHPDVWRINSTLEFSSVVFSGVGGSGIGFFLQSWCVSKRGPLYSATFTPLSTVITTILATVFLYEQMYIGSLLGSVGVIMGLYIVLWGKSKELESKKLQQVISADEKIRLLMDDVAADDLEQTFLGVQTSEHDEDDAIKAELN